MRRRSFELRLAGRACRYDGCSRGGARAGARIGNQLRQLTELHLVWRILGKDVEDHRGTVECGATGSFSIELLCRVSSCRIRCRCEVFGPPRFFALPLPTNVPELATRVVGDATDGVGALGVDEQANRRRSPTSATRSGR